MKKKKKENKKKKKKKREKKKEIFVYILFLKFLNVYLYISNCSAKIQQISEKRIA